MVRVSVVGGINVDVLALVDHQPDDAHPAVIQDVVEAAGGKGANQAVAAARLGASVRLFGAVGDDDDGRRVLTELEGAGVDCRHVRRVAHAPTGRVLGTVTVDGSKRTAALGGANLTLTTADIGDDEHVLTSADVVICQLEPPGPAVAATLAAARHAGVPALLDLAPAQGPARELAACATWVTGNYAEVEAVTGVRVRDEGTASAAATVLLALGPSIAGVTAGSRGQLVAWPDGRIWCPAPADEQIVDTTGAGDAFAATLAVLLAEGMAPDRAAMHAARASTLACRRLGAQAALPTRAEIDAAAR